MSWNDGSLPLLEKKYLRIKPKKMFNLNKTIKAGSPWHCSMQYYRFSRKGITHISIIKSLKNTEKYSIYFSSVLIFFLYKFCKKLQSLILYSILVKLLGLSVWYDILSIAYYTCFFYWSWIVFPWLSQDDQPSNRMPENQGVFYIYFKRFL